VTEHRDEPGPVVQRAIDALRELPAVRQEAIGRILEAAARSRLSDAQAHDDDLFLPAEPPRRSRGRVIGTAIGTAAAIILSIVTINRVRATSRGSPTIDEPRAATMPMVAPASASRKAIEAAPIPTQFVFDGRARHVSLVGDFNNWDPHATQLDREPGSTLWSVTVPIARGRHVYAFLVDSVWTVDKRAPVARDPDFGVTGSVILVGRP